MSDLRTAIDELRRLVAFPTISADSNLSLIDHVAGVLESHGAVTELQHNANGTKANLFATFGPMRDGGIVLSGHTDVVPVADQPWSSDPFELTERDGKLFGRGTCDMKGFIAACIALAPRFAKAAQSRPLHMALTYDEETGCLGGQALVEKLSDMGLRPAMALIGEPTEMRVIEGHKGCYEYTTRFTGSEGHGSAPDLGVNAVEYAVRYVNRLIALADHLRANPPDNGQFDPPWTTINTGALRGGIAPNVIPGLAEVEWEMRPVQASDATLVQEDLANYVRDILLPAMQEIAPDTGIETKVIAEVEGLEPMDENAARDLCMELTGANGCGLVPFATEAGLFQKMGTAAVVCGPGSIAQAHKADEFLAIDQLEACLGMLSKLCAKL